MSNHVEVIFWDVNHGHATYIKSPNEKHIVIDLGIGSFSESNETFSPLLHLKNNWRINQIDYVIITHPHKDHIDDIENFDELSPKMLLRPNNIDNDDLINSAYYPDKQKFTKYKDICERYCGSVSSDNDPTSLENMGNLKIKTFQASNCSTSNINNQSFIAVFSYAGLKIVIPGDNESCSMNELMEIETFKSSIKDADVLLAPHHGRDSGYHLEFVKLVNPRITIISDGSKTATAANTNYTNKSRGWTVYKKDGSNRERKTLSTFNDGYIVVKFGFSDNGGNYLNITTGK